MTSELKKVFDKYRELLKSKVGNHKTRARGRRSKERILLFFEKNGKWPSRLSKSNREKKLGYRFENYTSKVSLSYDAELREIVMITGRKSNNKRKHNISEFKKEIVSFIETYGRVPTVYCGETIPGEGKLRAKLDYYTKVNRDTSLLGKVYSMDKCHMSGIPMKFRRIINLSLETEKPLIRLAKYELENK